MNRALWICAGVGIGIIAIVAVALPQVQPHDDEACAEYGDIARYHLPQFTRDLRRVEAGLKDIERRILVDRAARARRTATT